ncbi:MAG: hypothetical protein CMM90_00750 [Rickettsiales bacterium]|nr:hypothetical protein [Rickettsiales bacterium]|tara:strand:- start:1275 stop:3623 length:2349 start_codon:yes stop_codon:yes gene_type:complete
MTEKLSEKYTRLSSEWSSTNKGKLDDYKPQSNKKFEWVCIKNKKHIWVASLQSRTQRKSGCPYCAKQKILPEESFADTNTDAYKLWHPTKNDADPFTLSPRSSAKKHWWMCLQNPKHEWKTTIASVAGGSGCPFCAGQKVLKEESFGSKYPNFAKFWHPTKNSQSPFEFTTKSEKKVWWICSKNPDHEWDASIASIVNGGGCAFCAGKRVLKSESLGSHYPELSKEWHPTKNGKLTPFLCTKRSNKNVWWQCPIDRDHVYKQTIYKRSSVGVGCPFCSGKRLTIERSLALIDPEMSMEWHPTKNNEKTPETTFANSNKNVWWQCLKEPTHEWKTSPNSRRGSSQKGCPFCSNQRVHETNSLPNLHPKIASEWHPTKNGSKSPDQFVAGSAEKVWWQCSKELGHVWKVEIRNRTSGSGCPYCTRQTSSPEIRIYAELQSIFKIVENRIKIKGLEADIFLPESKTVIEYDGAYWHRERNTHDLEKNETFEQIGFHILRVREKPLNKLSVQDVIVSPEQLLKTDIDKILKNIVGQCSPLIQRKIHNYLEEKQFKNDDLYNKYLSYFPSPFPENALSNTHPEIAAEWDYTANFPLTPANFTAGSNKKVWWICDNASHKWQSKITNRRAGKGCHFCSGHKPSKENNLEKKYPELLEFWHPTKNGEILPSSLSPSSNRKIWWKCSRGADHEWEQSVNGRIKNGKPLGCPFCGNKRISKTNNLEHLHPDLANEWDTSKNLPLTPDKVVPGSSKSVWWICKYDNRHRWKTRINHRSNGSGCPYCSGRLKI